MMRAAPRTWRSMMFVPATGEKFVARAHTRGADMVILDLEDSIPPTEKQAARDALPTAAATVGQAGAEVAVRINRALDLAVLITEMDVREQAPVGTDFVARDQVVAERVHAFASAAFEGGARTLLTWGIADRWSWLEREPAVALPQNGPHRGLPYDWEFRRKPYWRALARAFLRQPAG